MTSRVSILSKTSHSNSNSLFCYDPEETAESLEQKNPFFRRMQNPGNRERCSKMFTAKDLYLVDGQDKVVINFTSSSSYIHTYVIAKDDCKKGQIALLFYSFHNHEREVFFLAYSSSSLHTYTHAHLFVFIDNWPLARTHARARLYANRTRKKGEKRREDIFKMFLLTSGEWLSTQLDGWMDG